ncbi:MAG: MarR family transcriptional regulator [Promethearchaeota archaeon]
MLDLLASKGTEEILKFLRKNPKKTSVEINRHFIEQRKEYEKVVQKRKQKGNYHSESSVIFPTTATIYRRLKELELAGFIIREPPGSNQFSLTQQAMDMLDRELLQHPEITELKRSHRALLHQIKQHKDANVIELQEKALLSPTTINVGLKKLINLGLIEQAKAEPKGPIRSLKRPGRPKKRLRITKKGEKVYMMQAKLEEEQTK